MPDQMHIQFDSPQERPDFKAIIRQWTDEDLQRSLVLYERLVEVHSGKALPRLKPITKKLDAPDPMPWMLPAYESGLTLIKQEIERRKEVTNA